MTESRISTKILVVIISASFFGVAALAGTFAYLLNRDYQQRYDTNLKYYLTESARRLQSLVQSHNDTMQGLAESIQNDLRDQHDTSAYWPAEQQATFIKARRRLDLYSSVFVANDEPLNAGLLTEIARTHDAWENVYSAFDSRVHSVSYISRRGFIRTQPSHRVAFFSDDYDPRNDMLYRKLADTSEEYALLVGFDGPASSYVLSIVQPVVFDDQLYGAVTGVFGLPLVTGGAETDDRFQPILMIINRDGAVLASPLENQKFNSAVAESALALIKEDRSPAQVRVLNLDNTLYRTAYQNLGVEGWGVLVLYPQRFLNQRIAALEVRLLGVLLIVGVILMVFANVALRRYVVRPVQQLTKATSAISESGWHFQPPTLANDEIGALANVIDTLASELRSTLDEYRKTIISLDNMSRSLSRVYSTLDATDNMTAILEADWRIIYANEKFLEVFPDDCINRGFETCYRSVFNDLAQNYFDDVRTSLANGEGWTNEIRVRDSDGASHSYLEKIICHYNAEGQLISIIYNAQALFQNTENAEKIERLAYYDHLTGLQNRTFFKGVLEEELASLQRSNSMLSLLYVDLDNFKNINDTLGHEAGDALLIEVAQRMKECLRTEDAIARIGGDEFAVLIKDIDALHYVSIVANKIIQALNQPLYLEGQMVTVGASIGVTVAPDDGDQINELMKNADLAMYQAKDKGRNNFRFYTQDMNRAVSRRMQMERELKQALDNQEFVLHFQPKVHLKTGRVDAAEALVRWYLPNGEIRGPNEFIPAAEDSGLILELGLWILKTACYQAKTVYKALNQELVISVNVSAQQLTNPGFVEQVKSTLAETGLKASLLELEITESLLMSNLEQTIQQLQAIRELGVHISIDDFGTGYSSLSHLKRLPIDQLKIDRSFVTDLPDDEDDRVITELIVSMAQQLKLEVVAEGVETDAQEQYLQSLGCDYVQGYLYAKPLPPDELMVFIFNAETRGRN